MPTARNIHYDISDRARAVAHGGIGSIHLLARKSGLIDALDARLHLLKVHLPYHESDHVLNIAHNNWLSDAQRRCGTIDWLALAIAEKKTPIPDTAAFRIDFARFLRMQNRRDRRVMKAMIAGEPGKAVARRFGLSPGRVSQLRRRFERDWAAFHGELATQAA